MFTLKKHPQSILGAVADGFRLCKASFPNIWHWLFLSAVFLFLWDVLGEYVLEDSNGFSVEKGAFYLFMLTVVFASVNVTFSIFLNYFICARMNVVATNSDKGIGVSAKLVLRRLWSLLGVFLAPLVAYFLFFGPIYFLSEFMGNSLVTIIVMVIAVLSLIYLNISLFFSYFFILFDNQKTFPAIKSSFFCVHKNSRHVFFVLFLLVIIVLFISLSSAFPDSAPLGNLLGFKQESEDLIKLGDFFDIFMTQFFLFFINGMAMSIFYNIKAREGLACGKVS